MCARPWGVVRPPCVCVCGFEMRAWLASCYRRAITCPTWHTYWDDLFQLVRGQLHSFGAAGYDGHLSRLHGCAKPRGAPHLLRTLRRYMYIYIYMPQGGNRWFASRLPLPTPKRASNPKVRSTPLTWKQTTGGLRSNDLPQPPVIARFHDSVRDGSFPLLFE